MHQDDGLPANSSSASSASTSSSSGSTNVSSFSLVLSIVYKNTVGFNKNVFTAPVADSRMATVVFCLVVKRTSLTRCTFLGTTTPSCSALAASFLARSRAAFFSFCRQSTQKGTP